MESAKKYKLELTELELNAVLNALDRLSKQTGIINQDGAFSTGNLTVILNTSITILNQVGEQNQEQKKESDGDRNE